MRCLFDVVHIVPDDKLDEDVRLLPSGLYIAEIYRKEKNDNMTQTGTRTGLVTAIGPDCKLKIGERVLYNYGRYVEMMIDDKLTHICHEAEILGTLL